MGPFNPKKYSAASQLQNTKRKTKSLDAETLPKLRSVQVRVSQIHVARNFPPRNIYVKAELTAFYITGSYKILNFLRIRVKVELHAHINRGSIRFKLLDRCRPLQNIKSGKAEVDLLAATR